MALRSSTSVGAGVAIALLSILTLGLFVLSVVFYGKYKDTNQRLTDANVDYSEIIRDNERINNPRIQPLMTRAGEQRGTSLVGYLADQLGSTMQLVGGDRNMTFSQLQTELAQVPGADQGVVIRFIREQRRTITESEQTQADLQAAIDEAHRRAEEDADRYEALDARRRDEVASQQQLVGRYVDDVKQYDAQVRDTIDQMQGRVDVISEDYENEIAALQADIENLNEQIIVQTGQITELRKEAASATVGPQDESALVDATVIGTNPASQTVILDKGRRHNIVLGMNFEVYASAALIHDADSQRLLRGKASIEVISIEEQTCTARIIRANVADPILDTDVCANPAYDPNKRYRFLVYGEFDTDFDGRPSSREADDIKSLLEQWGGKIVESIEDNVDFLVLGAKPIVGPTPGPHQPFPLIAEWQRRKRAADRYDNLFNTASATSIPVLNQNRLFTLIGYFER
ncbi:MAG: hypothetical protein KAS72_04310 [Phycisphaerales bacterium]|nr:hypothetical protein [Phycisphaerales bacterium]